MKSGEGFVHPLGCHYGQLAQVLKVVADEKGGLRAELFDLQHIPDVYWVMDDLMCHPTVRRTELEKPVFSHVLPTVALQYLHVAIELPDFLWIHTESLKQPY